MSKLSPAEAGRLGAKASAVTQSLLKQKRIDAWNANPKLCKQCQTPISYLKRLNDFCSQSCGATFNNSGIRRHGEAARKCLHCSKEHYNDKYCSQECMGAYWWTETKQELISLGIDNSSNNIAGKRYLTELHKGCCQICNQSEWMGQPMPLVLDHISGNPYDNSLQNLRVICHNCNAQTPTFAGRNKGNGRVERARRYHIDKEDLKHKPISSSG